MNYSSILRVLDALKLAADDVIVDIGSGRGRVLCCAARRPVRKVLGVDLSAEFCDDARRNAAAMRRRRAPVEVYQALADEFDYSECTAAYLFSPFGPETLAKVLSKIRADRAGRSIRFAYANTAFVEVFDAQDWLKCYQRWSHGSSGGEEHAVAFYRSL